MIVELKSVGSVIDTDTRIVYPKYQMGGFDKLSGTHIDELDEHFVNEMSEADITLINELPKSKKISPYEDLFRKNGVRNKF
jgi:hypothetical protein